MTRENMSHPNSCHECPVWKKSLFKDFDHELIEWLAQKKVIRDLFKGDILFHQDDGVSGLYCHMSGLSKVIQKDSSDKIRFTRLVYPGDTSGHRSLFISSTYRGSAIALSEQVSVCHIKMEDIHALLAKNSSFAKNLIIRISSELIKSEENLMAIKEKSVRARLAQLIYNLAHDFSDVLNDNDLVIKSEITKREFAKILLVADETIIRLMSEMIKDGVIDYLEKKLVIKNLTKLVELTKN